MIALIALFSLFLGAMTDGAPSPVDADNSAQESYADSLRW